MVEAIKSQAFMYNFVPEVGVVVGGVGLVVDGCVEILIYNSSFCIDLK